MSTLKTTNVQHPDSETPNIVLAADGSVEIDNQVLTGSLAPVFMLMGA